MEFIFTKALKLYTLKTAKIDFTKVFALTVISYPKPLELKMPWLITQI